MKENKVVEISKEDLRKIAVVGTHLHKWQGKQNQDLQDVFKQQAMVQLDPLNPAGRNHDIFFFSRIKEYKINNFQKIVYPKKEVFEAYFPNLMAISSEHFPLFRNHMKKEYLHRYYKSSIENMEKIHKGILAEAKQFIVENGPVRAADMKDLASKKPEFSFWKTSNLAGMALEVLWLLSDAVIVKRDEHFRKIYGLTENYFNDNISAETQLNDDEINFNKFLIKQKSYPLMNLGNVSYSNSNKLIIRKRKNISPKWFRREDGCTPKIVSLEGNQKGFAVPTNWEEFLKEKFDNEIRAIAPLDPLIWDREALQHIFDFDYTWEVYKIPRDRKWGYYVYPLLFKGNFIGRLEAKFHKKNKLLEIFNFTKEEQFDFDSQVESALFSLFDRWKESLSANNIKYDKSVLSIR